MWNNLNVDFELYIIYLYEIKKNHKKNTIGKNSVATQWRQLSFLFIYTSLNWSAVKRPLKVVYKINKSSIQSDKMVDKARAGWCAFRIHWSWEAESYQIVNPDETPAREGYNAIRGDRYL